jgi:hypothetical protein
MDKTMFGIKFLNQKRKNCKIYGKEPGTASKVRLMSKGRTETEFEREAFNQLNIVIARNRVAPPEVTAPKVVVQDIEF